MANFVIECPNCGKYTEAKTGFLGIGKTRKIKCTCKVPAGPDGKDEKDFVFSVETAKIKSKECPHCGNNVVFDQSKGEDALCPVCKKNINTADDIKRLRSFSCPQCGCGLSADKGAAEYKCPICDMVIDVPERLKLKDISKEGFASVIKYEGDNNTFVWKHPVEDFNIGSQLIVHESQEAIFYRNGEALDTFRAGRYMLETESIPLVNKAYNNLLEPKGMFHAEVYFVNLATQMGIKWGTDSKVRFLEPVTGIPLDIGACGEFNMRVSEPRKLLLKLVGTESVLDRKALLDISDREATVVSKDMAVYLRSMIMTRVKTHLAKTIKESKLNILEIDEQLDALSSALRERINEGLAEYGLTMPEFFVTTLVTPDDDPNFKKLKQQHADLYLRVRDEENLRKVREAEAERRAVEERTRAQLKIIEAQGEAESVKITAGGTAEQVRLEGLAEAEVMAAKGYNQKDVLQADVQKAYAEGIGNMGGGGGGGSGGGGGGSIASDVLGIVAGFKAADMMGGQLSNMFAPLNAQPPGVAPTQPTAPPTLGAAAALGVAQGGAATPSGAADAWDCACGEKAVKGNFCMSCGAKKPEPPKPWACPKCGANNDKGLFCSNCGEKKPVIQTWDCPCGEKSISGNFCSNCGKKREDR